MICSLTSGGSMGQEASPAPAVNKQPSGLSQGCGHQVSFKSRYVDTKICVPIRDSTCHNVTADSLDVKTQIVPRGLRSAPLMMRLEYEYGVEKVKKRIHAETRYILSSINWYWLLEDTSCFHISVARKWPYVDDAAGRRCLVSRWGYQIV